jgi:hypothetical protein
MLQQTIRPLLLSIALVPSGACVPVEAATATWDFQVFLDDKEIGSHRFDMVEEGGGRTLRSKARFNVRFLFVNAYHYEHEALEGWEGDCLASLKARTDDNGTLQTVEAEHRSNETVVRARRGTERLGQCVMTFAYWNPTILTQARLLNAQNGEYVDVSIEQTATETLSVGGASIPARRYALRSRQTGGPPLAIDLWYSQDNRWLALESVTAGGRRLKYRLK